MTEFALLESIALTNLEHDSLIALEWFDNSYMKLNSGKCHLFIPGGSSQIWGSSEKKHMNMETACSLVLTLKRRGAFCSVHDS